MSLVTGFTCKTCNILKEKDCFRAKKDGTADYDNCLECWRGEAKLFWKRRNLEYVGVVMRSYHCGCLQEISTMFHLHHAPRAMKKQSPKSIENCDVQPPALQQCQALRLMMLNARFVASFKIRSLSPRRVILHTL